MNVIRRFLTNTLLGGVLVVLPIYLVVLVPAFHDAASGVATG
jgi:hypothetical protein